MRTSPFQRYRTTAFVAASALVLALAPATAANAGTSDERPRAVAGAGPVDPALLDSLSYRNIGPVRGGRSIAVAGSEARPNEYYFGATGGGLWKTTDGGTTWRPVTDGQIATSSVGAVEVCPSDPDVVYIGMGEVQLRGNVIPGDGVYKSTDGGVTWSHVGLKDAGMVGRIRVHPQDCDRAYVAALGHAFGPNEERGVFRTDDGGGSWRKVLYRDDLTGAADLSIDPNDPETLYAGFWHVYRKPWLLHSGGDTGGLFKSTDGGDTWTELTDNPGMPAEPIGKVGVSVSGADSQRVYAIIEADNGGVFRSDDGGATWQRVNADRDLRQRAFYYTRLNADPRDRDVVYVLNVGFYKSTNGGTTYDRIPTPHGDNHDLWIAPDNPNRMIEANDGGANVSTDGGNTWTAQDYSTAQMYHVTTTNDTPYLVCGGQQDNSTSCVSSEGDGRHLFRVGGGESGYIAVDPRDSNVFYAGSYGGYLTRYDRRTDQARNVNAWPDNPMGHPARNLKERFQWTFPIVTSPLEPEATYAASQHVFRSENGGQSWKRISPDLTRADPETLGDSGGPITKDQTSIEYYATVFSVAPSPIDRDVIWAGSDDGLVHVTRAGGGTWDDVTPPDLPTFTRVSMISASAHAPGTAYVAAHRYRLDDQKPYLLKTHNYGRTWKPITSGIPDDAFLWAVREDPKRPGLLYAGTQDGVYVSFDDGEHWQSLRLNMPDLSVQDLVVKGDDLVVATHGRGFYILDGLSLVRRLMPGTTRGDVATVTIDPPTGNRGLPASASPAPDPQGEPGTDPAAENQDAILYDPDDPVRSVDRSAAISYELREPAEDVTLTVLDGEGREVRSFTDVPGEAGRHEVRWDLRYPGPTTFPGLILWAANPSQGPKAPLGGFQVRLTVDGQSLTEEFDILKDPRLKDIEPRDIDEQFALATRVTQRTSDANASVIRIRDCSAQVKDRIDRANDPQVTEQGTAVRQALSGVENAVYQTKLQSRQDPLNYPIKLNNKIAALLRVIESADNRPTDQTYEVFDMLSGQLDEQLGALDRIVKEDVARFNALLTEKGHEPVNCG